MRTIRELAKEAIEAQTACNLSGVVHSFSRAMTDLREIARSEGWESTEKLNTHPIAIVWSSKIASLTHSEDHSVFCRAYDYLLDVIGKE